MNRVGILSNNILHDSTTFLKIRKVSEKYKKIYKFRKDLERQIRKYSVSFRDRFGKKCGMDSEMFESFGKKKHPIFFKNRED